jgi:hypothetical protein
MPQGLGGGIILPKSSCNPCRQITQKIEELCLRKMLLSYRLGAGLVQHPHEIPDEMEVWLERANTRQRITVSRKSIPDFLLMPVLSQRPGILIGQPPGSQVPYHFQLVVNQREMQEAASRLGGEKLHVPAHIDMEAYFQMIAKIAHGFAVAILEIDGFYPYLQPMIVRRQINLISYLIGASFDHLPVRPDALSHQVGLGLIDRDGGQLLRCRVCLFAFHQGPAYDVIVGQLALSEAQFASCVHALQAANPRAVPQRRSGKTHARLRRGRAIRGH